ncbi:MAG: hypothetical protein PGN17_11890 [Sphingomonas adhaesiva]
MKTAIPPRTTPRRPGDQAAEERDQRAGAEPQHHQHDPAGHDGKGGQHPDEIIALVLHLIGDVERGHHRGRRTAAAIDRDRQCDDEAQPLLPLAAGNHHVELLPDQTGGIRGKQVEERADIGLHRRGIGDEAIGQHGCGQQRRDRGKGVEGRPRGDQPQIVVVRGGIGFLQSPPPVGAERAPEIGG